MSTIPRAQLTSSCVLHYISATAKLQESIGPIVYGSAGSGTGSLILLEAFMDCDTHTLVTVATDRSFKLWDLAPLARRNERKGSDTGAGISVGAGSGSKGQDKDREREQPKSFFKFSSSPRKSQRGSVKDKPPSRGVCAVPCIGRIIPGTHLPPSLSKFVSCAAIHHPRYPFGTFAIVSKTNSIGIVQVIIMDFNSYSLFFRCPFLCSFLYSILCSLRCLLCHEMFSFRICVYTLSTQSIYIMDNHIIPSYHIRTPLSSFSPFTFPSTFLYHSPLLLHLHLLNQHHSTSLT